MVAQNLKKRAQKAIMFSIVGIHVVAQLSDLQVESQ